MPEATFTLPQSYWPQSIQHVELCQLAAEMGFDLDASRFTLLTVWSLTAGSTQELANSDRICDALKAHGFDPHAIYRFTITAHEVILLAWQRPVVMVSDSIDHAKRTVHIPIVIDSPPTVQYRVDSGWTS